MHDATYLVVSFNFRTTPIAFATLWGRILILIGARALNNAMWRKCSFVRGDENAVKDHRNKSGMSYSLFTFTAAPTLLRRCRFFLLFRIDCVLRARAGGWALTARDTRERQENLGNVRMTTMGRHPCCIIVIPNMMTDLLLHHMVCRHPCCIIAIPNMMTDLLLVGMEMFEDGTVSNRCSQTVTINMTANSRSEAPVGCLCHATRIVCMT